MTIPFFDLSRQFSTIRNEILPALEEEMRSSHFVAGAAVEEFERAFARAHQVEHCVAVGSGTDALHAIFWALGLGPGDEVVTVSHTFIATAEAVSLTGATPVFVEIDPGTLLMDPGALERAITPATRAVLPVHLYGNPAPMERILAVAGAAGVPVVEDACQAHGASLGGTPVGGFGRAAAFSFYPSKNLGAFGEAGAVLTRDAGLATRMRELRDHGQTKKYHHARRGHNYRMDNLQGVVLGKKLPHLPAWTARRREIAALYGGLLRGVGDLQLPRETPEGRHVYHLYVVLTQRRDALQEYLHARGIGSGLHYPVPLHLQPAYASAACPPGSLPVTEAAAAHALSLPMFPELTDDEVRAVAAAVRAFFDGR